MADNMTKRANRAVCDVDIRFLKTMAPFLFFDTANTTTVSTSADSVYAMAKGSKRIAFQNPMEGTLTIEAQVYPFKYFALLSDGTIETKGTYAAHETIKATAAGKLTIKPKDGTVSGTVFAYPAGSYGDESKMIKGAFASDTFTATTAGDIAVDTEYEVGYLVVREKVQSITFTNKKIPRDYYITMTTVDKDENDLLTPFVITAYKASIQRSFELSFTSEGDPASVTLTFDLMENKDGNVLSMTELTEDAY